MKKLAVNSCRLLLAAVFIVSGFVKAVDPAGTQYKIGDYLEAMGLGGLLPDLALTAASVAQSAVEFCIGIFLLFAIQRRLTSRLALAVMLVMTPLTLWIALANPVSDCGCFGDALVLTNWQTFWKNVVLLACAVTVAIWPKEMFRFVSRSNQWIVINYSALFILAVSAWSLYDLPLFDFRPYHIGADIRQGMAVPDDAPKAEYETTFIMEKDGKRQEFSLDNYPDSTWTFVDSKTVQTREGYVPPIHDFSMVLLAGDTGEEADEGDITDEVLSDTSYVVLLVSPHLEQADDSRHDLINELFEYCQEHAYPFYCLTASTPKSIRQWQDMTGAEYPFCQTDETTLKTVIRSNPGLVLMKDGKIVNKWSRNALPEIDEGDAAKPMEQLEIGQMPDDAVPAKILRLLLWFVLPLVVLTVADRMWMWTKWIRKKKPTQPAPQPSTTNTTNPN